MSPVVQCGYEREIKNRNQHTRAKLVEMSLLFYKIMYNYWTNYN